MTKTRYARKNATIGAAVAADSLPLEPSVLLRKPTRAVVTRMPKRERAEKTRERILDTAEELFAEHGLFGVTLKEVSIAAKVNTALVHYYFTNKENLFAEVLNRRARVLDMKRLGALDEYARNAGQARTVEGTIEAFVSPMLDLARTGGPGWKNYFRLVAQADNAPGWGREVMNKYFDPLARRLISELREIVPDADEKSVYWSCQMFSGALMITLADTGRIDRLSNGLCRSSDLDAAQKCLIAYSAAGVLRLCTSAKPAAKKLSKRRV